VHFDSGFGEAIFKRLKCVKWPCYTTDQGRQVGNFYFKHQSSYIHYLPWRWVHIPKLCLKMPGIYNRRVVHPHQSKAGVWKNVLISSTDNLKGFTDAIKAVFPQTKNQICIVHQLRNSLKFAIGKEKLLQYYRKRNRFIRKHNNTKALPPAYHALEKLLCLLLMQALKK
jgi:hypothetical protein